MHSEDDQIVPYVAAGPLSAKLRNGTLKNHKGFPHGMPTTEVETINADLLAFLKARNPRSRVSGKLISCRMTAIGGGPS
jgi:hypothetical protein